MSGSEASVYPVQKFLFVFALILVSSKVFGELAERVKQPAVLGELIAGVILGVSVLALVPSAEGQAGYETFHLLAEIGVAILLFEIGLETDLGALLRLGIDSTLVAVLGVATPFFFGYLSVVMLEKFGILSGLNPNMLSLVAITAGATLTATSVGITARVLSDLNRLHTPEAQIVLGAAVIDDVLGLIILAVVSGLIDASRQGVDSGISLAQVLVITLKAFGFLLIAIAVGRLFSRKLFDIVSKMQVRGVLLLMALSFALIFAYVAQLVGLAPIVGAFAAGLVLSNTNQIDLIESRIKPVADVLTPVFFIMVGARVDVGVLNPFVKENIPVIMVALLVTVVAVAGKMVSGFAVIRKGVKKLCVGIGMIPRGEVGLIFAQMGLVSGVFDTRLFSAMAIMVMITTFVAPPLLKVVFANTPVGDKGSQDVTLRA